MQRTVQYIAGAGIGYQIVQSNVGPGTHVSAEAGVPEHSFTSSQNEISSSEDDHHTTGPSGSGYGGESPAYQGFYPPSAFSSDGSYPSTPRPFSRLGHELANSAYVVTTPSSSGNIDRNHENHPYGIHSTSSSPQSSGQGEEALVFKLLPPKEEAFWTKTSPSGQASPSAPYPTPKPLYLPSGEVWVRCKIHNDLKNMIISIL